MVLQAQSWWEWLSKLAGDVQRTVLESITSMITGIFGRLPFLLAGLIVIVIFWLLSKAAKKLFLLSTRKTAVDARLRLLISRMLVVIVVGLGVLTALTVVIPSFNFGSLIAGLGFSSFVVGFATKDILNNFLSGILILWQRPFHIGDYLFVGNNQGKVEYIGVRATSLRKDDGELVLIPNGDMYSTALTIRGKGAKRRMNMKFCVGYDDPLEQVKELTKTALNGIGGIVSDPPPRVLVSELIAEGVNITVNFWINTNESKPLEVFDHAAIAIIEKLDEAGIEVFPPGSMIVQRPKEEVEDEVAEPKKKSDL
ncbi:MAG: mechanosensitive ion channel family protein [Acidobacteria bacterium]|nr:mechanosensitive ion channel family protein [Acidobacteriota bacterium]